MRKTTYACDRCGKPLTSKTAVKLNINIQRGSDPVEKQTQDYCSKCFVRIKKAYEAAMRLDDEDTSVPTVQEPAKPAIQPPVKPLQTAVAQDSGRAGAIKMSDLIRPVAGPEKKTLPLANPADKEEPKQTDMPVQTEEPKQADAPVQKEAESVKADVMPNERPSDGDGDVLKRRGRPKKNASEGPDTKEDKPVKEQDTRPVKGIEQAMREGGNEAGLKLGPIKAAEKDEILRLYIEEELNPDEIALKLNRLPRGIKRAINSAEKNGELEKARADFREKQEQEAMERKRREDEEAQSAIHNLLQGDVVAVPYGEDDEEDIREEFAGSGASDAGIVKDSYTAPPQKEVIDGRKYDVGCILALAKAGWKPYMIADEKHYDVDVVRILLEKYMPN